MKSKISFPFFLFILFVRRACLSGKFCLLKKMENAKHQILTTWKEYRNKTGLDDLVNEWDEKVAYDRCESTDCD